MSIYTKVDPDFIDIENVEWDKTVTRRNWRHDKPPEGNDHLQYKTEGNVTAITFVTRKFGTLHCLIDTEDLDRVISNPHSWSCVHMGNNYYVMCNRRNGVYILHRFILKLSNSDPTIVDHINGNGLDCRKANMRKTSTAKNILNRTRLNSNNTSGYVGVSWNKLRGRWQAYVGIPKGRLNLGYFDTAKEASRIVEAKRLELLNI